MNRTGGRRRGWRLALAGASVGAVLLGLLVATPAAADAPLPSLQVLTWPTVSPAADRTVGDTVTASAGVYSPAATDVSYQWLRDGLPIDGATNAQYTYSTVDEGQSLTAVITAQTNGYQPIVDQYPIGVVTGPDTLTPVQLVTPPVVSAVPHVGQAITVTTPGAFTPADAEVIYDWTDNSGSHYTLSPTFTPSVADQGENLTLKYWATGFLYKPFIGSLPVGEVIPTALAATNLTVSGSAVVGSTLGAGAAWNARPDSLSYQWLSGNTPIAGATSSTYVTQQSDIGNVMSVQITAQLADLDPTTVTATSTFTVSVPFPHPPTPTVTGTEQVFQTVTAHPGDWGDPDTTFTYTWYVDGENVSYTSTSNTFLLTPSFVNKVLYVVVTGTAPGFGPTKSPQSAYVDVSPLTSPIAGVKIGPASVGETDVATIQYTGQNIGGSYNFVWMRNGVPVQSSTSSQYTPVLADEGAKLTVSATVADPTYAQTPVVSNAVVVKEGYTSGPVSITGNIRAGSTVHADTDGWPSNPTSFKYEWYILDTDGGSAYIPVSRASSFTIPTWALGKDIELWVQGFAPGYLTDPDIWWSTPDAVVQPGQFASLSAPVIGGLPTVGARLTASAGSATPSSGDAVRYQWYSAATKGGAATAIAGATSSSYLVSAAMAHRYITVRVTRSRSSFASLIVYSAWTAEVLAPASQRVAHPPAVSHASSLSDGGTP